MNDAEIVTIECATCPATGTTACGDCIVTHVLAIDSGPIEYAPTSLRPDEPTAVGRHVEGSVERAIELFAAAGLLDDPPRYVDPAEFGAAAQAPRGSR
jgi:hypothetical protein